MQIFGAGLRRIGLYIVIGVFLLLTFARWNHIAANGLVNMARLQETAQCLATASCEPDAAVVNHLQQADSLSPKGPALEILSEYYFHTGQYADAAAIVGAANPQRPWAGPQVGWALYELGREEDATAVWRATGGAEWILKDALYAAEPVEVENLLMLVLKIDASNETASGELAMRYARRAVEAAEAKDFPAAKAWLSRAAALQKDQVKLPYAQLATVAAVKIGDYEFARDVALAGVKQYPHNDQIHSLAAMAYARLGQMDAAIEQHLQSIAVSKRKPRYQLRLAQYYAQLGRIKDARRIYTQVVDSGDPRYIDAALEALASLPPK